ncbi:hypothetical protein KIN20_024668 [Parelaphostrongylus tenuis]|uniref:Reverse transcriptase domain-containing protein n=1 Tax=Parelaphostrongylus tenuis TaxID=148309 RepID=A0AAD5MTT4_PARTN|nr:hypothetical protein KIN20_024668 [Parelaphostrongylus tenuis]
MALLKKCLNCSILEWSGKYYAQMRGLPIGQRLAPCLANAFMSKVEAPVMDLRPLLYCTEEDVYLKCGAIFCSLKETHTLQYSSFTKNKNSACNKKPSKDFVGATVITFCIAQKAFTSLFRSSISSICSKREFVN